MAVAATALLACSSGGAGQSGGNDGGGTTNDGGGTHTGGGSCIKTAARELVTDRLKLPTTTNAATTTGYGYDLNGDQTPENKFAGLASLLDVFSNGGGPQSIVDAAVESDGSALLLLRVNADSLTGSACAELTVGTAAASPSPDFTGNGDFALDGTPTKFSAAIASSHLETPDPVGASTPSTLTLRLALFPGAAPLTIPLVAAHIAGTLGGDNGPLSNGVIHGAIKQTDLRDTVIPAVAASLNALLQDPSIPANTKSAVVSLLDKGCSSGDGFAGDQFIDACEVSGGPFKSSFTPDLDLYADTSRDADGNTIGDYGVYAPTPSDATSLDNDALSFGIGFTAVGASF